MAILRTHKTRDYTVMSNHHLNNPKLSLKAKGLMSFMLSKPDTWDFSINGLKAQLKEGRDSISSTLNDLEENKYLIREQARDNGGVFQKNIYHIFEKPTSGLPITENPTSDNPIQVSTIKVKTKQVITNKQKEKKFNFRKELLEFGFEEDLVSDWLKVRKDKKASNTKTALNGFISQVKKSNVDKNEILKICVERSWRSFKASWDLGLNDSKNEKKPETAVERLNRELGITK